MAETVQGIGRYGKWYYIDSSLKSEVLTSSEKETNALYIYSWCKNEQPTWTLNAIAAILGNMESEGVMNPSQWQYGSNKSLKSGYGLVQWTPATNFIDWATENNLSRVAIDSQMLRIEYERATGIQYYKTSKYNFSFTEFLIGNYSVDTLARAWLYNYERPKDPAGSEGLRASRAENWYAFLTGSSPIPPNPDYPEPDPDPPIRPDHPKAMPLWMYPGIRNGRR